MDYQEPAAAPESHVIGLQPSALRVLNIMRTQLGMSVSGQLAMEEANIKFVLLRAGISSHHTTGHARIV